MNKWVAALLILFPVHAYSVTYPISLPGNVDDIDYLVNFPTVAVVWEQSIGKPYCAAGNILNLPNITLPDRLESEPLSTYIERSYPQIFTRGRTPEELLMCQTLHDRNKVVWRVQQVGSTLHRPLYRLLGFSPATKEQIGTIPTLTPCGAHIAPVSARIKALEWREVNGGVSVCKRQ